MSSSHLLVCAAFRPLKILNNAGKTSILCHLANVAAANKGVVESVGTAPTVGTQMVEFRRRNTRWIAWDMSGQGTCAQHNRRYTTDYGSFFGPSIRLGQVLLHLYSLKALIF